MLARQIVDLAADRFRRAHLDIARAGAGEPIVDRREPPLVVVGGEDLALVLHHGRERQRLAAGAGAEIDHLLARLGAREQGRKLRALVLHLDDAFDERRLGVDGRALGLGRQPDAQAPGRPRRRLPARGRTASRRPPSRSAFSVLTRRSSGARDASAAPSSRAVVAEDAREMRVEPFRIIAGDMRRRAADVGGVEPRALVVAQRLRARSCEPSASWRWRRCRARARA